MDDNLESEERRSPDLSGRQLDDYRILRRLGRGAMAEVYLADQSSLRRQVAIKVLRADLANDASYVQRFHNEARAAAALVHPNIVQIHEVGHSDGIHYIVQEYVRGQNLAEVVRRRGAIDAPAAVNIIRQVAAALAKAGEHGIVHRDIKPDNIMLARTGEVKVADFGLARSAGGQQVDLTQVGVTMGTPLYMSPEQVEGRRLDPRSDIYSLGVTSYHMLTGRTPFNGDTALAVAVQHLNASPEPIVNLRPDLPDGLSDIVNKMLNKKPADRYANAGEILHALQELDNLESNGGADRSGQTTGVWNAADMEMLTGPGAGATARLDHLMKTAAMFSPRRRRWGSWIGVGVCVLMGVAIAGATRDSDLLPDAISAHVPIRHSAWAQLYHAKMTDAEAAWRAVWEKFNDPYTTNLAKQGLVMHFLAKGSDYDEALVILDELAALGPSDESFVAFGHAGRCVVLERMNRPEAALEAAARLDANMLDQLDPQMRDMLRRAEERSRP